MRLKQFFKDHFTFIKFTASSLFSTAIDLAFFTLLIHLLEPSFPKTYILIATTIARNISRVVNYSLNKKVVFKENNQVKTAFIRYVLLSVIQMLLSGLLVTVIVKTILPYEWLTLIIFVDSMFFLACLVQKCFVFPAYWIGFNKYPQTSTDFEEKSQQLFLRAQRGQENPY